MDFGKGKEQRLVMSIYLYTGTPGSGKSIHMAKNLFWQIKMKRPAVANFEINNSMFADGGSSFVFMENDELRPDRLEKIARDHFEREPFREGAIKLYIDEAQIKFNSRDWRNNAEWIKFFTQHRKMGYDVVMVAQHHEMLDKQIRTIVEYEVHHRKVNNVGLFGRCVGILSFGHPVIVAVTTWYGQKMRLGSEWMLGTGRDYKLYDSYKLFRSV